MEGETKGGALREGGEGRWRGRERQGAGGRLETDA